jgi:hypothetical protein
MMAWQQAVIDLQSFGIAGLVSLAAEHSIGRMRPFMSAATGCLEQVERSSGW